jgi:hypothetical protein
LLRFAFLACSVETTQRKYAMKNMGNIDRVLRMIAVLAIAGAYAVGLLAGPPAIILGIIAVAFFITSLIGTCPIYLPFGLSTLGKAKP